MSFDKETRNLLARTVTACRRGLIEDVTGQLTGVFGLHPDGTVLALKEKFNESISELDQIFFDQADISEDEKVLVEQETRSRPSHRILINYSADEGEAFPSTALVSYLLGLVFGRWDTRIALDLSIAPKLTDAFDPLPVCPPGMLVGPDGLPAEPNRIVSEEWLRARPDANTLPPEGSVKTPTIPDSDYPLRISWNGKPAKFFQDHLKRYLNETRTFLGELHDLREEMFRIAALPYKPDLNDGVIINASPFHNLFNLRSWANDTKKVWDKLKKGDYVQARLAYTIWPDRLRGVCKKDRSIAIAHGLEDLCEVENPASKKKGGRGRRGKGKS